MIAVRPRVVVHDNHHGVGVRFKVEDGDGAVVVVDPSAVEIVEYALPGRRGRRRSPAPGRRAPKRRRDPHGHSHTG